MSGPAPGGILVPVQPGRSAISFIISHAYVARLHGTPRLARASGEPLPLERKQALVLAYLALEGPTPRGRLAHLLWPDASEARARGNLRQRLAVLRQAAGAELVDDVQGVLSLAPLLRIEAAGDDAGELLASFDYVDSDLATRWLDGRREAQRSSRHAQLLAAVRAAVQAGQLDEALRLADRLLALDRESEESYRALMEVLYLRGDSAAAIAVWDRCKEMLRQLYGVLPAVATRQLGETILAAAKASALHSPVAAAAIPITVLRPPRLIGRLALLQSLVAAWRSGRTPWVSGEAGLGKSRLLAEFAAAAGPCATASARPGDASVPYVSLERLVLAAIDRFEPTLDADTARQVARLLPRLAATRPHEPPPAVHTDFERRECLHAVAKVLAACTARGCSALVMDDLQFADAASIEAALEMAGAPDAQTPLRFVFGTRRDEPAAAGAGWLAALEDAARYTHVALAPLDEAGVTELIASLGLTGFDTASLAQRLWRQVGGNPTFVLESIKLVLALGGAPALGTGSLPLAPDIVAVIERRVGLLSPQARHLAQLASIAGESYGVPLAAMALACTPLALSEPMRELELRQVLYGRAFVHDVIAVAVRRTIAQSVAEFMHRFVAEYLVEHEGDAARIASHWQACGEFQRAGEAYRRAAGVAADASRPVEQSQLLDEAAACFERAGATDLLFDALEARQTVALAPDAMTARLSCMTRMEALAHTEEQHLRALLCRQGWDADHSHTDAVGTGLDAIERARSLGLHPIAFEFAVVTAWRLALRGDESEALQTLQGQRAWVMSHAEPLVRTEFRYAMSAVLAFVDRLGPAIEEGRLAVAELRLHRHWTRLLPSLGNLGLCLHWRGELAEAEAAMSEARELRDRMHGRGSGLVIDLNLASVRRERGDYIGAEPLFIETLAALRGQAGADGDTRTDCAIGEGLFAHLWLSLGRADRALELLSSSDAGLAPRFHGRRVALRLRALRMQGVSDRALVQAAEQIVPTIDSPFHRSLTELELTCARPPSEALPVFERLLEQRSTRERPGLQLHIAARGAEASLALGDAARARRHLAPFEAMLTTSAPYDIDRGELWRIAIDVLQASREIGAADALLAHAVRWLTDTAESRVPPGAREGFVSGHRANAHLLSGSPAGSALPRA